MTSLYDCPQRSWWQCEAVSSDGVCRTDERLREMWAGGKISCLIYRKAVSAAVQCCLTTNGTPWSQHIALSELVPNTLNYWDILTRGGQKSELVWKKNLAIFYLNASLQFNYPELELRILACGLETHKKSAFRVFSTRDNLRNTKDFLSKKCYLQCTHTDRWESTFPCASDALFKNLLMALRWKRETDIEEASGAAHLIKTTLFIYAHLPCTLGSSRWAHWSSDGWMALGLGCLMSYWLYLLPVFPRSANKPYQAFDKEESCQIKASIWNQQAETASAATRKITRRAS